MNIGSISIDQWIIIGISLLTFLFGGGLVWRFFLKHPKAGQGEAGDRISNAEEMLPVAVKQNPHLAKVKINVGGYREFEWGARLVKISVLDIVKENFKTVVGETEAFGAELKVNTGGGLVYGGKCAKECAVNQYKVPAVLSNYEEPYSLYFFHSGKDYLKFFRVFVEHIDPRSNEVTLNVFFFRS